MEKNIVIRIEKKLSELLELNIKKTAITNGGRIGKRQIGWSKVLRSQPQLASRCMFTLYEDGVYGIRSSSSCDKLGGLLVYSELKF